MILEIQVSAASKELEEDKVQLEVLEAAGSRVRVEVWDLQDHKDLLDRLESKAKPGLLDHQVQREQVDHQVKQEAQDSPELQAHQDSLDKLASLESREQEVLQVLRVQQDPLE